MSATLSGPMFESSQSTYWESIHEKEGAHYNTFHLTERHLGMEALRNFFPTAEANEYNFCIFSTSGVHGYYNTIEEVEADLAKSDEDEDKCDALTFLIVSPRIVCTRYGNCYPKTKDDIEFLKKLRESSKKVMAKY